MSDGQRPPPDAVGEAIAEIVRYAVAQPAAMDAIEGIHRWWLPDGGERWRGEEVEAALEWLVERGWMVERILAGRRVWAVRSELAAEMVLWSRDLDERHG